MTLTEIQKALTTTSVTRFGEAVSVFEPTAARCSSSSSTCCTGCVSLK